MTNLCLLITNDHSADMIDFFIVSCLTSRIVVPVGKGGGGKDGASNGPKVPVHCEGHFVMSSADIIVFIRISHLLKVTAKLDNVSGTCKHLGWNILMYNTSLLQMRVS